MEKISYSNIIKENWRIIFLITGGILILVVIFNLVDLYLYPEYRASVKLLIIQKQDQRLDAYTAVKSAEKLGNNLSQVISTTSFFDKVMSAGFNIENIFPLEENKKRKQWEKMIETEVIPETGILKINVYYRQKNQAVQIAEAIAYILITEGEEYHGGGKDIQIKMVDAPLTSQYPVRPNILLNSIFGLISGLILAIMYVILKESKKIEKKEFKISELPKEQPKESLRESFAPRPLAKTPEKEKDSIVTMHNHLDQRPPSEI